MQIKTGDVAARILAMEDARYEENRRVNADRDLLLSLSHDRWRDLKKAFSDECEKLTARSHKFQFECDEPDSNTFHINRVFGDVAHRTVEFTLDLAVPRVTYEVHHGKPLVGSLEIVLSPGRKASFADGRSGVIISEFVSRVMLHITR